MTYSFVEDNTPGARSEVIAPFAIDRYSGKVVLKQRLDYETRQEYQLQIAASDTLHLAHTTLTIRVIDVNDNAPVFQQPAYHVVLPGEFGFAQDWHVLFL